ncbi:MAG: hypothetical protein A2636_02275 [Elusimicrobia bacterium RIFCSPHIGHO2_01_FULL_64_10]|nr:MAG: hypothetical protein A2636_02275 [Elusimicrobia bacterium RIFCSPHIGHO2_01_FULL_64_10]
MDAVKKRILVVDDDRDMSFILNELLEAAGYAVDRATDGEDALACLGKARPDLVVTDVMLPKMNGWGLCRRIKEDPETGSVPILVITAKGGEVDEMMSYESGANAHIAKPFDNEHFLKVVRDLLSGSDPT